MPHPEWEKIFANHVSNKRLVSKIQRELKFNNKNPIQCLIKYLTNICPKIYKQPVSTWTDLQHYQSLRKYKSKLRRDATSHQDDGYLKTNKKQKTTTVDKDVKKKKRETVHYWWKMVQLLWKAAWQCLQKLKIRLPNKKLKIGLLLLWTSLVAQMVKRLSTMRETRVQSLGWEDPLEKEMATHSSTITWKIPWTEEPGRLQSMGSQRVGHDCVTSLTLL